MGIERSYDFDLVARELEDFFRNDVKTVIGVTAVNFFKSNFIREGFKDGGIKKWMPLSRSRREQKGSGKRILTDSGDLRRSINYKKTNDGVLIYADEPYAEIHNEGGQIIATVTVSEHPRSTKWGTVTVKEHTRNMNTTMPQRQFMGYSEDLIKELDSAITQRVKAILDKGQIS